MVLQSSMVGHFELRSGSFHCGRLYVHCASTCAPPKYSILNLYPLCFRLFSSTCFPCYRCRAPLSRSTLLAKVPFSSCLLPTYSSCLQLPLLLTHEVSTVIGAVMPYWAATAVVTKAPPLYWLFTSYSTIGRVKFLVL